ncbi:MAG: ATP-dependent DNA helicase, partial [Thermomicrobiales bacterium]
MLRPVQLPLALPGGMTMAAATTPAPTLAMTAATLNMGQAAAVAFGDGPLRIMAGAGTGKTHTLTQRIVALIAGGHAAPGQILALTFTVKAVDELKERIGRAVDALPGWTGQRVDIDTYHAFGGRVVAKHGQLLDLPPEPLLLTPAEGWILLWRALDEIEFRHVDLMNLRGGLNKSPLSEIISLGSRLRDELRSLDDLESYLETADVDDASLKLGDYARALRVYERKKRDAGAIDYGDQIALACEVLDRPEVAAAYHARYRYVLVDEFQDTNFAQSVLASRLVTGPLGNICVVGDPNQAIYAFRGAAPDNLDRFADTELPSTKTIELSENFRSTQAILDVANAVWTTHPGPYRGNLVAAANGHAPRPALVQAASQADEIAFIAAEISRAVEGGRAFRDIAVLVRKNAVKREVWRGLRERRIPAEAVGGASLYETPEVRELISFLRALGDPADDPSFAHVLCSETWGLDEAALYALALERLPKESLMQAARRLGSASGVPAELTACLGAMDRLTTRSYRIGLGRLVDEIAALRRGGYDALEAANVQRFRAVVRAFAESRVGRPSLDDLLAYLDLLLSASPDDEAAGDSELDGTGGAPDTVKIMTAHASKGLEWPIVFVAGANSRDFVTSGRGGTDLPEALTHPAPGRPRREMFEAGAKGDKAFDKTLKAWIKEQGQLEEQRVLYVALTRARERLTVSWARTHPGRKNDVTLLPSLAPVAAFCAAVTAPSSMDGPAAAPTFRDVAPRLLATVQPYLGGSSAEMGSDRQFAATLERAWRTAGGSAEVAERALPRFLRERAGLDEQLAVIRAVDARRADAEVLGGAGGSISHTQLEMHRACPHRYHLQYVVGLPGVPEEGGSVVGVAFHDAIATEAARRREGLAVSPDQVRVWNGDDPTGQQGRGLDAGAGSSSGLLDPVDVYL